MESFRKKQKIKYFHASLTQRKMEREVNQFLEQNPSINVKSIAVDHNSKVILLYEEEE